LDKPNIHVRPAKITDIPEIVLVCNSSILPWEDIGFGGGIPGPFQDPAKLASIWKEPNIAQRSEIWVAEMRDRIVGVTRIENKGDELELIDIDVPLDLQGQGIGTQIVRSIEERARREGKRAVTLGTSRNAEGVAWKSLPWWQHLGYWITHEEENEWTRTIASGATEIRMRKDLDYR